MERVAIVEAVRTPFVKAQTVFSDVSAIELAQASVKGLVSRLPISPNEIEEIAYGAVLLDPRIPDIARELIIRSGLPATITGNFVANNCISGLVCAAMISDGIKSGRIKNGIAGGVESMSKPSLLFSEAAAKVFLKLAKSRTLPDKLKALSGWRPSFLMPEAPSPKEPSTGLTMGEHCELMVKEFGISRARQDEIAFQSHKNASKAKEKGYLAEEIIPIGKVNADNIMRADTSLEKLSSLRPVFDRSGSGSITAGNASPLTDGASAVFLMSESEVKRRNITPLGFIEGIAFASIKPNDGLLMAPAVAVPRLLAKHNLKFSDIDRFEIHEAFGAQVAANMDAWEKGWSKYSESTVLGQIPAEKINVNGGSIALGHPFAATGGRLLSATARELKRSNLKRGLISVCAAGGGAAAVLITTA